MKQYFLVSVIAASVMMLSSCGSNYITRYQIFTVSTTSEIVRENESLVYEDQNCKLMYNFWANGGNLGFSFFNKTSKNLYIDLGNSFYVKNNLASPYFKNRTFSSSATHHIGANQAASIRGVNSLGFWQTNTANVSFGTSNENTISYTESRIVVVPAHTSVVVPEVEKIIDFLYNCNLEKSSATTTFNKESSPFLFRNSISYSFNSDSDYKTINNEFFISVISNHGRSEIIKKVEIDECGRKSKNGVEVFSIYSSNKFYIPYLYKY